MAKTKTPSGGRKTASKKSRPQHGWVRRAVGFLFKWTAVAAVWAVIAIGALVAWYATDLPDVEDALTATRQPTVTLLAADGSSLATVGDVYGLPVRLRELPLAVPQAVLATEDRRFYNHFGIDIIGLSRAMYVNLKAGRIVQGGSTITQQVAKNLFLTPERTIKRKVQEVILALWLEQKLSKDHILTVYLNRVYLGAGTFGVDAASRKYFGHPARQLSTYEAAMLAGLLKAPSRFNPATDPKRADSRARLVLANMVRAGYLNNEDAKRAAEARRAVISTPGRASRYFVDWVLEQVSGFVTPGNRDLVVVTTLDPVLQRHAEAEIAAALAKEGKKSKVSQAALVAMAPNGAVRAMVGGRDYGKSQFNRATQALRQPGSAFKPVVYLAGLEAGLGLDSRLSDAPVTVNGWTPRNFDGKHRGEVSLMEAMAGSVNTVAVRVAGKAGYAAVVDVARRLGVTSDLEATPSLALGTGEITLTELTSAYAVFANGGHAVWPHGIAEIRDGAGNRLYARTGSGPGRVVAAPLTGAMNRLLAHVIDAGTGKNALLDRPAAGKTGTSQNYRDAWFVGYTADLVAGIWMGNDDGRPTGRVTGGGLPAKIWQAYMTAAHRGVRPRPLAETGISVPGPEQGFWKRIMATLNGEGSG
jgi:penicillin-binding protein 1A